MVKKVKFYLRASDLRHSLEIFKERVKVIILWSKYSSTVDTVLFFLFKI